MKLFGSDDKIEIGNFNLKLYDIGYFEQYNLYTVGDVYKILGHDPCQDDSNGPIFSIWDDEITGDELDLVYQDFQLHNSKFFNEGYLKEVIKEEGEDADTHGWDIVFEMQSDDQEFQEEYINYLESIKKYIVNDEVMEKWKEVIDNAKEPRRDNIVIFDWVLCPRV